ncbi:hypothetical protein V6N13_065635 [Hibiscus sabdariffa]
MTPLSSVNQAYSMLLQEESQRVQLSGISPISKSTAMFSSASGSSDKRRLNDICDYCKIRGHKRDNCYRLHGFPYDFQFTKKKSSPAVLAAVTMADPLIANADSDGQINSPTHAFAPIFTREQYNQLLSLINKAPTIEATANLAGITSAATCVKLATYSAAAHNQICWILETDATDHMLCDFHSLDFPTPRALDSHLVHLPNGKTTQITHTGSFSFNPSLMLPKVLYVPQFTHNLLSVSQLTKDIHCSVMFYPDFCILQDLYSGRMKGIGTQSCGLYFLDSTSFFPEVTYGNQCTSFDQCSVYAFAECMSSSVVNKNSIWHARLGHAPLNILAKTSFLHSISLKPDSVLPCSICPLAKQTHLPFQNSTSTTSAPFELIHIDLWGPYRVFTYTGHRFFLTIVYDKTRLTWVYLMRLKSDAVLHLKPFCAFVQNQYSATIKTIRNDNGTEFFNSACSSFFLSYDSSHVNFPKHSFVIPPENPTVSPAISPENQPVIPFENSTVSPAIPPENPTVSPAIPPKNLLEIPVVSSENIPNIPTHRSVVSPMTNIVPQIVQPNVSTSRRSTRHVQPLLWLNDYVHSCQSSSPSSRLQKSLYGLKQASRQWNLKLTNALLAAGYKQNELKLILHSNFKMKDLGDLKYFLGLEILRSKEGIVLNQRKYALELIEDTGVGGAKPAFTPLEQNKKFTSIEYDGNSEIDDEELQDNVVYQRLIGSLIYLTHTRPGIMFVVHTLSQFMHRPKRSHLDVALRIVRYIKRNPGRGVFLSSKSMCQFFAYCDSDWESCPLTRRSVTGFCIKLGDSLMSWKSKNKIQ